MRDLYSLESAEMTLDPTPEGPSERSQSLAKQETWYNLRLILENGLARGLLTNCQQVPIYNMVGYGKIKIGRIC